MFPIRRFNMFLITHDDQNAVVLWDLAAEKAFKLDFTQELVSMDKKKLKMVRVAPGFGAPPHPHPHLLTHSHAPFPAPTHPRA